MYTLSLKSNIVIAGLLLLSYIWIALFGLPQTSHMAHSDSNTHNCPYMMGQHSICPMEVFHHLGGWQAYSKVIIPLLEILLFIGWLSVARFIRDISPPQFLYIKKRYGFALIPFLQHLFSQGILHPKAP